MPPLFFSCFAAVSLALATAALAASDANGGVDLGKLPDHLQKGVLRVGLGATPEKTGRAGVGDEITVELKNFDGWLMDMVDYGKFGSHELMQKVPADVKGLIEKQQFRFAIAAANWMQEYERDFSDKKHTEPPSADELAALAEARDTQRSLFRFKSPSLAPPDDPQQASAILASFRHALVLLNEMKDALKPGLTVKINGQTLQGITPSNPGDFPVPERRRPPHDKDEDTYEWLHFTLDRNAANEAAWSKVLARPAFTLPATLTLAVQCGNDSLDLPSMVHGEAVDARCTFAVAGMSYGWTSLAIAIVLFCFAVFAFCAATTDILRDVDGDLRPDGRRPFSLAKSQMAVWFFLIITSFLFLWAVTKQIGTLNDTCLVLIGIGSGTALGAAVIAAGRDPKRQERYPQAFGYGLKKEEISRQMDVLITAARKELDECPVDALPERKAALQARLEALQKQMADFQSMPRAAWQRVLTDLLSESDSGGVWSFHRFQMFTWTLVLCLIFVVKVWSELKMPDFNTQLLALVGISAGTYLGFKLPGTSSSSSASQKQGG